LISDFRRDLNIVYFLLGISPASYCSWPTFRNPVSVPSSKAGCTVYPVHPAFEDGTDTGFRNVGQLQYDAGEIPKRKYTILCYVVTEKWIDRLYIVTEFDTRVLTIRQWRGHGMSSGVSCFTVDVI